MLALDQFRSPQPVDRAMLRGGHEPGARVVRGAGGRPPLECGDERVLRKLLGKTDVAHHPRETGDELRLLYPPDRVDRAMRIGSRHGCRLEHLHPRVQAETRLRLRGHLREQTLLLLPELRRELGAEVLRLEISFGFGFES